jgi:hypothetical protein
MTKSKKAKRMKEKLEYYQALCLFCYQILLCFSQLLHCFIFFSRNRKIHSHIFIKEKFNSFCLSCLNLNLYFGVSFDLNWQML